MSDGPDQDPTPVLDPAEGAGTEGAGTGSPGTAEPEEDLEPLPDGVKAPRANRSIWVMVLVAALALALGLGVGRFVISPAERAAQAEPPTAGPVTAPVESRVVANTVLVRGDARFDDPVEVKPQAGEGAAVVTGQVPAVGAEVGAGAVILEITGRPVIALPGELPAYRTLVGGAHGPDVVQLKQALAALGIDGGDAGSDVYDWKAAAGVAELYKRVGYSAPLSSPTAADDVDAADEAVDAAQTELDAAKQAVKDAPAPAKAEKADRDRKANRLERAKERRTEAQQAALTPLPIGEVVFLSSLPRRVDAVNVQRGSVVSGAALTVSGATLQVIARLSDADADLITAEMPVTFTVGAEQLPGKVAQVRAQGGGTPDPAADPGSGDEGDGQQQPEAPASGAREAVLVPVDLTPEQTTALVNAGNVKVQIPVASTGGEVLAVPVAALTAGAGGEYRVEVSHGGQDTELVKVTPGLSAGGFVEIASSEKPLQAGDLVVVGR